MCIRDRSCTGCSWQLSGTGQWWTVNVQVMAEGGSVPCWGSVAVPEKWISSPIAKLSGGVGALIVTTGGSLPALIVTLAVLLAPSGSVTCTRAGNVPGVV